MKGREKDMKLDELLDCVSSCSDLSVVDEVQSTITEYIVKRDIAESKYNDIISILNKYKDDKNVIAYSNAIDIAFDSIHSISDLYACKIYNIIIKKYGVEKISSNCTDVLISLEISAFYSRYKDLENALGCDYKDKYLFKDIIRLEAYELCFERSRKNTKTVNT